MPSPYKDEWRKFIRKRDNNTCQMCGHRPILNCNLNPQWMIAQGHNKFEIANYGAVHHLDWNPYNNVPENMVFICWSCHAKIHHGGKQFKQFYGQPYLLTNYDLEESKILYPNKRMRKIRNRAWDKLQPREL